MKLKEVNSKLDNYTKAIGKGIINQHIKKYDGFTI